MIRFTTRAALSGVALALMVSGAQARPPFAEKEGKKCNYCHAPAPPKLGYRALYYKMHNLTFEGFDDAAEAKKAGVEVGPDPEPKPKSWTAPKAAEGEKPASKAPEAPKGPSVADLKKKSDAASAALAKKPKDAKLKAAAAQAMAEYGHGQMLDQTVPPRQRYPQALATLRKAKALDPKNKVALDDIKAIEDAYTSMGMPIPK
ncbi:hypothetical protein [Armatimonas rosea]|uniref:Cytochrome c domain-containing protein n=1 Tax=Armatimonas rosea TaxID=685828 RepID=A0A7W9SM33_ARMRO|nr:hypothetical protein [Armatimonas rosea]MBB6049151.1 hypothetical protein [Armatimonas rosea]